MKAKPDSIAKIVRKREKEFLPILNKLREKNPALADHWLLCYMFLMMKDKATRFKKKEREPHPDSAHVLYGRSQHQ